MNQEQKTTPNMTDNLPAPSSPKKKKILPVLAVFVFTAALASVIIWFVLNRSDSSSGQSMPTPAPSLPTSVPTAVPTIAQIEKDLKIQVLNATEVNGLAAYLKEKLVDLGFTDITLGNSSQSLSVNQVKLKKTDSDQISAYFKAKIADVFPATYDPDQDEDDTYDLVFIIGTNIKDSDPSPSPTPEAVEEESLEDQ